MKTNKYFTLLLAFWALPIVAMQHVPVELNFSDSTERAKWQISSYPDSIPTQWVIGRNPDYAYGDNYMMYLSNDGGATRAYSPANSGYYRCEAYYPLDTLPAGKYILKFGMRGLSPDYNVYLYVQNSSSFYNTGDQGKWWRWGSITITSDGTSPYYVHVVFYNRSSKLPSQPNQGYAIDAIQIYPVNDEPTCAMQPQSLDTYRTGNDIHLTWEGNASEYQLEYFMNDTSLNTRYYVDNITTLSHTLHSETMPEGAYTFRVRAICGTDTSGWAAINYTLVYDITKHCMDYLNFNHPDVQAHYGSFGNPNSYTSVINDGFLSQESRHTEHHYPRDYDPRTNYKLRTFPEGQPAAIRLGNWKTGSEAENIVYTMNVTEEMAIMQLRYALVMQLPGHDSNQQPRFTLEFLDENYNLKDSCGFLNFAADVNMEGGGWHTEHTDGQTDIIWKDWSMIGLDMSQYVGQTIKVRVTTRDCSEGAHFGYAYFTMSCSPGKIRGIRCGVKPEKFIVEDGFNYRWYHKYDRNKTVLGTENTFILTDPYDTATYCVDMINMLRPECYFTLEASSLAHVPHAAGKVKCVQTECKYTYLEFEDVSTTDGVYWDKNGNKVVVKTEPGAEEIMWDFDQYGTSTEHTNRIQITDGDTLHIKLHAYMDNQTCEDIATYDLPIPKLGTRRTIDTYYFCHGGSITHNGKVYTEEIDFSDTLVAISGCDSISTVALRYFLMDTITHYDTLCSGHSMEWNGMTLTQGGEYLSPVKSKVFDCDSVFDLLYLYQQPYLNMTLDYTQQHVCAGNARTIAVPYTVMAGEIWTYDLLFSKKAQKYGLVDRLAQPVDPMDTKLTIAIEDSVQPGLFDASLVFHNIYCDSLTIPFTFAVYYDPDSLITQRWNDFLSVRKTAYDYYGGFIDYQWYLNDQPLAGQTGSQLYLPDTGLDPGGAYSVELTRTSDGMRVRTCPYYPHVEPNTVTITVYPTVMSSQAPVPLHIRSSQAAQANLYNHSGNHMVTWPVREGDNEVTIPNVQGLYLLHVITESGEEAVRKIIVQ